VGPVYTAHSSGIMTLQGNCWRKMSAASEPEGMHWACLRSRCRIVVASEVWRCRQSGHSAVSVRTDSGPLETLVAVVGCTLTVLAYVSCNFSVRCLRSQS
jgi:hypothetical protein